MSVTPVSPQIPVPQIQRDDGKKSGAHASRVREDAIDISPHAVNAQILAKWQEKMAESLITDLDPNQFLFEEAGKSDYLESIANPTELSSEATAGRILGGIKGFIYGAFRMQHPDMTEEDFEYFQSEVMKGFEQGISEAREILTALGALDERLATDVVETERLVRGGLDEFFTQEREQFASNAA
ncbi:MAG: hypothetical protein GY723_08805 [bacterium]|nr:hypothetical protein [bacterium]MCP5069659.1 hypothetical protein [bacterium]